MHPMLIISVSLMVASASLLRYYLLKEKLNNIPENIRKIYLGD